MKNEHAPNHQIFISPYDESLISAHIDSLSTQKEKRDFLTTLAKSCKSFADAKVIHLLSPSESLAEGLALDRMCFFCQNLEQAKLIYSSVSPDDRLARINAREILRHYLIEEIIDKYIEIFGKEELLYPFNLWFDKNLEPLQKELQDFRAENGFHPPQWKVLQEMEIMYKQKGGGSTQKAELSGEVQEHEQNLK